MAGSSEDLVAFVQEALARGVPRQRIEAALLEAGWPRDRVARALRSFAEVDFPLPVPRPHSAEIPIVKGMGAADRRSARAHARG